MSHRSRRPFVGIALALLLLSSLPILPGVRAQDALPPRPSHVHSGDCDEPGPVLQPLTDLTVPGTERSGNDEAVLAEAAFSVVPLTIDEMLASDHSLKVHLSRERIEVYLACGDIGGALDQDGALIVGLKELNGSGYAGIAYLVPNPAGGTSISVMIAKMLPGGGPADIAAASAAAPPAAADTAPASTAPDAAPAPTSVDVTLTEFAILMPATLPAGPVALNVTNAGTLPHNLVIEGNGISGSLADNLQPGTSGLLTGDLPPGTYTVFCPVGNGAHRANGMEVTLTVQ